MFLKIDQVLTLYILNGIVCENTLIWDHSLFVFMYIIYLYFLSIILLEVVECVTCYNGSMEYGRILSLTLSAYTND